MAVTGATFNFNKTVNYEEGASTPEKPKDNSKIETKVAGEKKGNQNVKDMINLSIVSDSIKTAVNNAIQNVEGSQLSEQTSALQTIATSTISSIHMAATNPYALLTSLACKGISYAFQQAKFNREKAWESYDLTEYRARRGYSVNRSRNSG